MKLSVVIAAYDERANIEPLVRRLDPAIATIPGCSRELIFVVEGRDGTREALERLGREIAGLRVLYQERRAGCGAAFRRGFAAVAEDADYVVTLDADLNHQPEEIPRLVASAVGLGADVLVGSRQVAGSWVEGVPWWKRALSHGLNLLMGRLLGLGVRDKTSGFRIYRAEVLRRLRFDENEFAFLPELLLAAAAAGYRLAEAPIHFRYRVLGRSKMAFWATSFSYLSLLRRPLRRSPERSTIPATMPARASHAASSSAAAAAAAAAGSSGLPLAKPGRPVRGLDRWTGWTSWNAWPAWTWGAALPLLAAGVALRVATAFPTHKYPADADCVVMGLAGLGLLHGHLPVFFGSVRVGALGAYPAGLLFLLFGASRATLAAGPMLAQILQLAAWTLFLRELLGARLALWGLPFAALPPAAVTVWTYMPNGYPEVLLVCTTTLWLAARVARISRTPAAPAPDTALVRGRGVWPACFALGVSLGIGWWASAQTLACSGPALAWLAWRRPRLVAHLRFWSLAALGTVLGALPWIAFNLRYSFPSLTNNYGLQPVAGLAAALDNARYLVLVNLPELLASTDGFGGGFPLNPVQRLLHLPALLISIGLSLFAMLAIPWLWRRAAAATAGSATGPAAGEPDGAAAEAVERAALPLCVLVIAASVGVYLVSFAGSLRGLPPVRYVMPIYLVVPVLFALSLHRLGRRSPALAATLAAAVLAFNLASTLWPWTAKRQQWAADAVADQRMLRFLEQRHVTAVIGPYWLVYPLNFLSGERVLAIPIDATTDFRHEIERLPPAPVRWALMSFRAEDIASWARAAGVTGEPCRLGSSFGLLLLPYDVPPRRLRELLAIAWWNRSTGKPGTAGRR